MKSITPLFLLLLPTLLQAQDELRIQLVPGHNLISCNVRLPDEFMRGDPGPEIPLMMEQLRDENGNLPIVILNNEVGLFYAPSRGFNGIPYWNYTQGYMLIMASEAEIVWEGERLPADTEVPIARGWNLISYMPDYELDASAPDFRVLAPILDHVITAMDGEGFFMSPQFEFSNMPPWRPGQGYVVNVSEDVVLRYPEEGEGELWQSLVGDHFVRPIGGKAKMPLLVNSIAGIEPADGDQIAAYTANDTYVGCGTVQDRKCGLALWEEEDGIFDGIRRGEFFRLRYWSEAENQTYDVSISDVIVGEGNFDSYGLCVVEVEVLQERIIVEQEIELRQGWNLISLNITPRDDYLNPNGQGFSIPMLFSRLDPDNEPHHVLRIVDGLGRFWVPRLNFNSIPEMPLNGGLWVQTDVAVTFRLPGFPREVEDAIPLRQGWNVIAYLPQTPLDASAPNFPVVSPILDHVDIAKDELGHFLLPERNFSSMGPWTPGEGYLIRVDQDLEFRYPEGR